MHCEVIDIATGAKSSVRFGTNPQGFHHAVFSPDGTNLLGMSINKVVRFQGSTRQKDWLIKTQNSTARIAHSNNRLLIQTGFKPDTCKVFQVSDGAEKLLLPGVIGPMTQRLHWFGIRTKSFCAIRRPAKRNSVSRLIKESLYESLGHLMGAIWRFVWLGPTQRCICGIRRRKSSRRSAISRSCSPKLIFKG